MTAISITSISAMSSDTSDDIRRQDHDGSLGELQLNDVRLVDEHRNVGYNPDRPRSWQVGSSSQKLSGDE